MANLTDLNLFGNTGRSGYDDIVAMGPRWWTEYLEMDTIYRYAGWTLDLMAYHLDRVMNNLFIRHANEATIAKLEKLLDVDYGNKAVTLDERRATVEAYFVGTGKLSASVITSIVATYTGRPSEVWVDNGTIYVRIMANDGSSMNIDIVSGLINRRIPAHMILMISQVLTEIILTETFEPRVTYRMEMPWWTLRILDGTYKLDGAIPLDQIYPMEFYIAHRFALAHEEMIDLLPLVHRLTVPIPEKITGETVRYRMLSTCRSGNLLDGRYLLDGSLPLDAHVYPEWNQISYIVPMETTEDIGMNMYLPSLDCSLNGSRSLDGSINLNSGREEL